MTTVFTRLYADEDKAHAVRDRLRFVGFPPTALQVIVEGGRDRDALVRKMEGASVAREAAESYAGMMGGGRALLVVRATYIPLRAPTLAREILDRSDAIESGVRPEELYVPDGPDHAPSVLKTHPRFLTLPTESDDFRPGPVTSRFGLPLLTGKRTSHSAIRGGKHVSKYFWPMPLVIRKRKANSAIRGGKHMSKYFWPMPLVTTKPRKNSVIRGGAQPFSRLLGWPTTWR